MTAVEVLAKASGSVELGPVGYAAVRTEAFKAYKSLVDDREALARAEAALVELVASGGPAAVVYAALLLRELGRDLAPLVARYADDRREVTIAEGGCSIPPPYWLCEAVRWVQGERWQHPVHAEAIRELQRAQRVEALRGAKFFELPSAQALEFAEKRVRQRDIDGVWTHRFLDLLCAPREELRAMRGRLDALATDPSIATRLYAALIMREIDREAGQRALAALAAAGGGVPCHRKAGLVVRAVVKVFSGAGYDVIEVPVAEVVEQLARWR